MADKADAYIGIFDKRWGYEPPNNNPPKDIQEYIKWDINKKLSVTTIEYYYARKKGIPVIIFVSKNGNREPELKEFLNAIGDYHKGIFYYKYENVSDLHSKARELINKLINKDLQEFLKYQMEYFTKESKIDHKRLKDYYVPNDLVKVKIDTWDKDEVDGDKWDIEEFLNGNNRFIIIGADFGTGKTSYCYKIAYELSKKYMHNAEGYIPILVELKNGFNDVYNNESLEYVLNHIIEVKACNKKVLLICEGLDEYSDTERILNRISKIKNNNPNIKIILTTRLVKEYYDIFAISDNNPIGRQDYYVRIKPFNEEQVNEFFRKYLGIEKIEGKDAYEYFIDLGLGKEEVCKPLFAYMLARTYELNDQTFKINKEKLNAIEEVARHRVLRTIIYHKFTYY